jgi:hypothetical protein
LTELKLNGRGDMMARKSRGMEGCWKSAAQILGMLVIGIAMTPRSHAATLVFATGFEPPTYALGSLNGQDGWLTGGTAVVENTAVLDGTQSAAFLADTSGLRAFNGTPVNTTISQIVLLQMDVAVSGAPSTFIFGAFGDLFNTLGGVSILPDGSLQALTALAPSAPALVTGDNPYTLDLLFDFTADAFSVYLNDNPVFTSQPFADTSNTQFAGGFVGSDAGGGILLMDNYSVTSAQDSTPEPSSIALGLAALIFLASFALVRPRLQGRRAC